jgi:hypothetical protein
MAHTRNRDKDSRRNALLIRGELLKKGWTISALGRSLGLTREHVSRVISCVDRSRPVHEAVRSILGDDYADLLADPNIPRGKADPEDPLHSSLFPAALGAVLAPRFLARLLELDGEQDPRLSELQIDVCRELDIPLEEFRARRAGRAEKTQG